MSLTSPALIAIISIWVRITAVNMPLQTSCRLDQFRSLESESRYALSAAFEARLGVSSHFFFFFTFIIAGRRFDSGVRSLRERGDSIVFGEQEFMNQCAWVALRREGSSVIYNSLCLVIVVSIDGHKKTHSGNLRVPASSKGEARAEESIGCELDPAHTLNWQIH